MHKSAVFPRPTQADIQSNLRDLFRGAVRVVLEMCLDEAARELVGARRYERLATRRDNLNGTVLIPLAECGWRVRNG